MLVPICEECYKKIVREKPGIQNFPWQGPDMPIKKYLELFRMYLIGTCSDAIETERKNRLFVYGLSDENKEEVGNLPFLEARLKTEDFIENIVLYLSEVDFFKRTVFGKRDSKPRPMDV